MTPQQASAALAWLIDMGADEVICEEAVNRFLAVAPAPVAVAPPAALVRPVPKPVMRKDSVDGPAPDASACKSIDEIQNALLRLDDERSKSAGGVKGAHPQHLWYPWHQHP